MAAFKIGDIARRAEVGVETIRYYERQGLLAEPERRPSGYRQYDESVISRLQFIRRTKELGFTLMEIKELLGFWFGSETRCLHVRQRAEQKVVDIRDKIQSLQKMQSSLEQIISQCEHHNSVEDCPLWVGLDQPRIDSAHDGHEFRKTRKP